MRVMSLYINHYPFYISPLLFAAEEQREIGRGEEVSVTVGAVAAGGCVGNDKNSAGENFRQKAYLNAGCVGPERT